MFVRSLTVFVRMRAVAMLLLVMVALLPTLVLSANCPQTVDWLNWGYDTSHSNENPCESTVTPSTVGNGFKMLWTATVDGFVLTQPLVISKYLPSGDDAVIVATTYGTVYMFDASNGAQLWKNSLGSLTPSPPCYDMPNSVWGVTGTPLVDRTPLTRFCSANIIKPNIRCYTESKATT